MGLTLSAMNLCMALTLLIMTLARDSFSQQSSWYQLYTRAAVSRYLEDNTTHWVRI